MKKFKIPKLLLIGLLVLTAATAWATQIKVMTITNGLGEASSSGHRISMTIGEPLAGRTTNSNDRSHMHFGFWELFAQAQFVSAAEDETPTVINQLFRNYPNPFNPSTRISFTLEKEANVRIELYDLKGRRVDTLFEGVKPIGAHSFSYQPKNLASGAYVILMRAGSFRATQRMMLVK